MWAENVAMTGESGDSSSVGEEFYEMWRSSSGHYENMMGDYPAMGVGIVSGGDGWYATEIFGSEAP